MNAVQFAGGIENDEAVVLLHVTVIIHCRGSPHDLSASHVDHMPLRNLQ
jgi:hypothetical protein